MAPISKLYQIFSSKAILPELVNIPNYLYTYIWLNTFCPFFISVTVIKYSGKNNSREKEFTLTHSSMLHSITAKKSEQEPKAVSHIHR